MMFANALRPDPFRGNEEPMLALGPVGPKRDWKALARNHGASATAFLLRSSGWMLTNALVVLGLLLLFAILLGGLSIEGTMMQLDNLSSRYAEADAARQHSFEMILAGSASGLLLLVMVLRNATFPRPKLGAE